MGQRKIVKKDFQGRKGATDMTTVSTVFLVIIPWVLFPKKIENVGTIRG